MSTMETATDGPVPTVFPSTAPKRCAKQIASLLNTTVFDDDDDYLIEELPNIEDSDWEVSDGGNIYVDYLASAREAIGAEPFEDIVIDVTAKTAATIDWMASVPPATSLSSWLRTSPEPPQDSAVYFSPETHASFHKRVVAVAKNGLEPIQDVDEDVAAVEAQTEDTARALASTVARQAAQVASNRNLDRLAGVKVADSAKQRATAARNSRATVLKMVATETTRAVVVSWAKEKVTQIISRPSTTPTSGSNYRALAEETRSQRLQDSIVSGTTIMRLASAAWPMIMKEVSYYNNQCCSFFSFCSNGIQDNERDNMSKRQSAKAMLRKAQMALLRATRKLYRTRK